MFGNGGGKFSVDSSLGSRPGFVDMGGISTFITGEVRLLAWVQKWSVPVILRSGDSLLSSERVHK